MYVGAAPGYHIYKLAEMFPELTFDLWDPAKFDIPLHPRITIHNEFFTDQIAKKYTGKSVLFISDIRNLNIKNLTTGKASDDAKIDALIENDNEKQKLWVRIIKPVSAFLKFRLPYHPGKTKYFTGKIYLQPYSPLSTETRLYTSNYSDLTVYDNEQFDRKMAYFNCLIRPNVVTERWNRVMDRYNIYDVWDNEYMLYVLSYYLDRVKNIQVDADNLTGELFQDIIKFLQKKYKSAGKYDVVYK